MPLAFDSAGAGERIAADEDASPGRSRGVGTGVIDPGKGIELLEEVDEGRNEEPLPSVPAVELHHQGDEIEFFRARFRDEPAEGAFSRRYVGVAEPQPLHHLLQRLPGNAQPLGPVVAVAKSRAQRADGLVRIYGLGPAVTSRALTSRAERS